MKHVALFCAVAGCVLVADLMSLTGLPEGRWAHPPAAERTSAERSSIKSLHTSTSSEATPVKTPRLPGRSSSLSLPDSIQHSVIAGEVLITTLPPAVGGRQVTSYEMVRTPAMSNLAGRAFFWRTRPRDEGRHRLLFRPRFDSTAADSTATDSIAADSAAADTLAIFVNVRYPN